MLNEFMAQYGMKILYTVTMALIGYIGIAIKNLYQKYVNDDIKKSIVKTCVKAVEQIYTDLHGDEKLSKCAKAASDLLEANGISISYNEIRLLIEAAVKEMNLQANAIIKDDTTEEYVDDGTAVG